ncbi:ph-response transcription factor pacc/rim101 [Anaeramoeba flamelloides]|uniref:Ph-response transcription factor pacc/rim101 n=1 Tax=Anaeramoeba flamelloides TaxID=1746091 RepID=A0ABQ8YK58_9EUKA|nr:ph-response transcription factor pacc/rim101 [Anaeramoeba flamelloides]
MFTNPMSFQINQISYNHKHEQINQFVEDSRFAGIDCESESEIAECVNFQFDSRVINNQEYKEHDSMFIEESVMIETPCKETPRNNSFVKEKLQEEIHEEQKQLNSFLEQMQKNKNFFQQKNNLLNEKRFNTNTSDQTNKLMVFN